MRFTLKSALLLAVIMLLASATTYAQFGVGQTITFGSTASNTPVRSQGITEAVGDQQITAGAGAATALTVAGAGVTTTAQVSIAYNATITNAATTPTAILGPVANSYINGQATLLCGQAPGAGQPANAVGVNIALGAPVSLVSGGIAVTFSNITCLPGVAAGSGVTIGWNVVNNILNITFTVAPGASLTFSNAGTPTLIAIHGVRVNASAASGGLVTASITSAPSGIVFLSNTTLTVGTVLPGLDVTSANPTQVLAASTSATKTINNPGLFGGLAVAPVTTFSNCTIAAIPSSTTIGAATGITSTSAIGLRVTEGFVGAFTTAGQELSKSGVTSLTGGAAAVAGTVPASEVTNGTQIEIDFSGVPSQVSLAVPQIVVSGGLTFTLVGPSAPAATTASFVASVGGAVQFIYAVTASAPSAGSLQTVGIPVFVFSTGLADVATISASIRLAPLSTVTTTSTTAPIVRFIDAPVTGSVNTISCITTLLFPFVTNVAGFDTGLSISNTGADTKKTSNQSGTCSLTFWDGTTANGTPTVPAVTVGPLGPGQSSTNIKGFVGLASVLAPGFNGYAIAKCNFQFAHGFAIVVNGFGSAAAPTVGTAYLALVSPDNRAAAPVEALAQ